MENIFDPEIPFKKENRCRDVRGMDFFFAGSGLVWSCWPFYSTVEEE